MSKIKFCALGGLGENGKNMYILDIDSAIFILDAGLKYPSVEMYGVDAVIPDINYLINNKDKIQGIFLSHGHEEHIGAVSELLKAFNTPIFGTHFTLSLVEDMLKEESMNIADYKLYRINESKVITFSNIKVKFFNISHSIPEAVGISIVTNDGAIVYAPDFTFTTNSDKRYSPSFSKINEVASDNVLLLLTESLGTSNVDRVSNDYAINHMLTEILQENRRIIFSMYSHDLDRIQKVIKAAVQCNRKIAIIGKKAQRIVNIAMENDYLNIPEENLITLKYMDDNNKNDDENLVIIASGIQHEPFYVLQRMCFGQDKLITITEKDHVVIIAPPVTGTERMLARTLDTVNKVDAKLTVFTKSILRSSHADSEDLKMMYSMMNPKYIIPVIGEYRHQYTQKNIALEAGYDISNIILLDNGQVATFVDKKLTSTKEKVSAGDVLVDGSIVGDINEVVIKDREMLAQDGMVIIITNVDVRNKKILSGPKVVSKGFMTAVSSEEMIGKIENAAILIVEEHFKRKYVDWNALKNDIREKVHKMIIASTKKTPIITAMVIDTEIK